MASIFKKKQFWGALIAIGILIFLFYDLNVPRTLEVAKGLKLLFFLPVLASTTLLVVF
jgi:hypothetical protein